MEILDSKTLGIAFIGGLLPSLIWLWFWLKEEKKKHEPRGLLTIVFITGMLGVILVLPIQRFIQNVVISPEWDLLLWASTEEIIKYLAVLVILYKTNRIDEPIDWPLYLITAALGFAALENMLFLIEPLRLGDSLVSLMTGQLRFLGSTLLHAITSALLGISLALSFHMGKFGKKFYLAAGVLVAISLHSLFNFFIINSIGNEFLKAFAFLWIISIVVMLLFEKVRRMN